MPVCGWELHRQEMVDVGVLLYGMGIEELLQSSKMNILRGKRTSLAVGF